MLLNVRVPKYCVLNLHLLLETGKTHTSFSVSLEEYEEALKVNALFDSLVFGFQYIHPFGIG